MIFVLELKKISANRCSNEGVAACYWNETLTYCASKTGPLVRSVAVEADDIDAAMALAIAKLQEQAA